MMEVSTLNKRITTKLIICVVSDIVMGIVVRGFSDNLGLPDS
jgi:hypothetical protein